MYSVSQRAKIIKQPKNGYLNPLNMECMVLENENLHSEENIPGYVVGLVVDYLSRYSLSKDLYKAFEISIIGAKLAKEEDNAKQLLEKINIELDDESIISACGLVGYDNVLRSGDQKINEFTPDKETIENIRVMVKRSMNFFNEYGPILKDGFTFESGYTNIISSGDGDFLTNDTLWDFKVLRGEPNSVHTLQLLIYYYMGKNSSDEIFKDITKVGIFNPRLNKVYIYDVRNLDDKIAKKIQYEVIGYRKKRQK